MTEAIGTIAGILVTLSFVFDGEKRIRWANLVGSVAFVTYGVMAGAWATAWCNAALILINAYKLWRKNG